MGIIRDEPEEDSFCEGGPRAGAPERLRRARAEWERRSAELIRRTSPALRAASVCAFEALSASVGSNACIVCDSPCEGLDDQVEASDIIELTHRLQLLTVEILGDGDPDLLVTALSQIRRCQALLVQSIHPESAGPGARALTAGSALAAAPRLIGSSGHMTAVRRQLEVAARGHGSIFLVGESGTGKELAARTLHDASPAAARPLVVVNCATLPRELVESELFGYRKGAYTGAERSYDGLVRSAHGGTLFLDEITEMTPEGQAKLLRVLEERAVRPIGTPSETLVDVRFIASTNRDPDEAVRSGRLREDIYHRLNVHHIVMPPLREHPDDIPELVAYFSVVLADQGAVEPREFSDEALDAMMACRWPGNVRGLRNAVVYALSAARGDVVELADLPAEVRAGCCVADGSAKWPAVGAVDPAERVPTFAEAERELIERALAATGGNKRRAAQILGISRHRLYDKIRKYEIST